MEVSVWARRLVKRELARGMSWVPGFVSMVGRVRGREGHTRLSTVLDQRVGRIGFCQNNLIGVGEVEVIEADNLCYEVAVVVEGGEEEGDEGGFPDALDAVDAYEEGG
jgi:hypothetical protein